ncbi:MAG: helix-turn-helix transcriptional regulator [Acidobacteria bacterium]|nr:helix-turn-helix transcriptional regulator [Acidobacteriota bacterium]
MTIAVEHLLILKIISLEPKHGWAIAKRTQQVSQEALQIQQGSLYPALRRLEQQAWIKAEWRTTGTGRVALDKARLRFHSLFRYRRTAGAELEACWRYGKWGALPSFRRRAGICGG